MQQFQTNESLKLLKVQNQWKLETKESLKLMKVKA